MSDRWETILAIFDAVRDAPTTERPALLSDRCGLDGGLRAEVESLLEHDVRAEPTFLAPKEIGEFRTDQADPLIGRVVAGYTIKEAIARGGMGTVYLAEQQKPRRDVALKVLQAGFWTRSAEKRFDAESHILGYLRHTNIAQVYEAGTAQVSIPLKRESLLVSDAEGIPIPTEEGARKDSRTSILRVHYFAMEYVPDARPITKYADEHSLTQKARLELFLQLCDAVAYGHQKGVIHRDLKPANVLVGVEHLAPGDSPGAKWDRGIVKVIDFGIARTVDSDIAATTMHTEAGQLLGTLAYMSPEQCAADPSRIDTTTDVYSLGVILYELLTGRMPYDVSNMTIQSAARVICEQEPRRPCTFEKRGTGFQPVKGDLETIILKAVEKSRTKRYQSVSDLSNDVRRLINGLPISARPPTTYSRILRWAAMYPKMTVTISSLTIAFLVLGSTFVSLWIVNSRPDRLELKRQGLTQDVLLRRPVRDGDQATLYSLGGKVLHRWELAHFSFGVLANRPPKWGGGKVVVLGFDRIADSPYRGSLCLFDANGPYDEPVWHKTVEKEHIDAMPHNAWPRPRFDSRRKYSSDGFAVHRAWIFNVFPDDDHPGDEIVAYHVHDPGTQGVLRIYDLNGDLLFQAWQDGGIEDAYWMADAGLLVFIGIKGDMDDKEYGVHLASNHPRVIFAIRPSPGDISNKWIHPHKPGEKPRFAGDEWRGEWYKPAWYKMPCPAIFANQRPFVSIIAEWRVFPQVYDPGQHLQLQMLSDSLRLSDGNPLDFSVILNQDGEIAQRLAPSDGVRRAIAENPNLPNPATLELLDWTTPDFPCGTSTSQPAAPEARGK